MKPLVQSFNCRSREKKVKSGSEAVAEPVVAMARDRVGAVENEVKRPGSSLRKHETIERT
jgi:hypothetical protein